MADPDQLDRSVIEAEQLESLRVLLTELIPGNRFYTAKLEAAGVGFHVDSLTDFSKRFPFTTKDELVRDQAQHPPWGTNLTYPLAAYTRFHQTSGTTGQPLRWLDTPESWDWMVGNWMAVYRAAGIGKGDRVYFAFSFGPFIGFWMAYDSAQRLGCLCLPGGGLGSHARVRAILDNQVTVLCCTPTYAIRLGEVALQENVDLRRSAIHTIIVAGEPGGSIGPTRDRIESLWPGARVFDHHGMTEVGAVTYQCPSHVGRLHVNERSYIAEIIRPETGLPVAPGDSGELVLTPLGRTGSPVLRYRTGDLVKRATGKGARGTDDAELGTRCECGRAEMGLEGGILGRVDDLVIVRGVNIHPSAVEAVMRQVAGVAEYQVYLTRKGPLTELRLVVEPASEVSSPTDLRARLSQAFESVFSLRVDIQMVEPGHLPRFEMKAKRWNRPADLRNC